ncbi:MAG: hemolysin III family protein [Actinomycetota bacterium]|nr:hemolysin III family protein [Actinomycetota bacterium]
MTAADPPQVAPSPAGALYDSRRRAHYAKPALRGWLHLIWFAVSLVAGPLLVAHVHGAGRITALAVYAASVTSLFGTSALYHRGTWAPAWSARLQRLDHLMIFFLIAGTATPVYLIAVHGAARWVGLTVIWTLTLAAAAIHLAWMGAPELLVGSTFIGLGLAGGLALPAVWIHAGLGPGLLMVAGGLLYIGGAVSYYHRWLNPSPAVFGYHESFHVCVCAAATCQFLAIALLAARVTG